MKKIIIIAIIVLGIVLLGLMPRMCGQVKKYEPITEYDYMPDQNSRLKQIVADGDTLKIYEGTSDYARVATTYPIDHDKLIRIGRELQRKFEPRIIYFHVYGEQERGEEYATYQRDILFDFRVKDPQKAATAL